MCKTTSVEQKVDFEEPGIGVPVINTSAVGTTSSGLRDDTVVIPENHNVIGTCGECGGPIITPVFWTQYGYNDHVGAPEWCMGCGRKPKKVIFPNYGPVREML